MEKQNDTVVVVEADEQWSYVGSKKNPRWLFYALDTLSGKVLVYAFGRRNTATLDELLHRLSGFNIRLWFTDKWPVYATKLPYHLHIASKKFTQKIERHNLNLRLQ